MDKLFKNYGLSLTLAALFLGSWVGQYYFQWQEFASNEQLHGQEAEMADFIPEFWSATLLTKS